MRGTVACVALALGNTALPMDQLGVKVDATHGASRRVAQCGARCIFGAVDALAGLLAVSDPIKATTLRRLTRLRKSGLRIVMATTMV